MKKVCIDRKWLIEKYCKEKLFMREIGKLYNVHRITIAHYLNEYNISHRSRGENSHLGKKNNCSLSKKAIEWINGELLGDGSLQSQSKYSARFSYGSKYLEYIEYVSNILNDFGIKQSGNINKRYHKNMNCYSYHYNSFSYEELLPIYKKWYPNGKKIVPRDIKLTPSTIRQWYIGDGGLVHRGKRSPYIMLYSYGFIIKDVIWLVKRLIKKGFKTTRQPYRNRIHLSAYSTEDFLKYIGECPVKCYQYKWAY